MLNNNHLNWWQYKKCLNFLNTWKHFEPKQVQHTDESTRWFVDHQQQFLIMLYIFCFILILCPNVQKRKTKKTSDTNSVQQETFKISETKCCSINAHQMSVCTFRPLSPPSSSSIQSNKTRHVEHLHLPPKPNTRGLIPSFKAFIFIFTFSFTCRSSAVWWTVSLYFLCILASCPLLLHLFYFCYLLLSCCRSPACK